VFGAYDHTNDKIHIHCYQKKTGKQFIDFLKRVEKRYDKNIQNIFLLDNLSAHKSKMVKEEISKCCPRIKFVFLPVRSPELNLIEVRWSWLQRQTAINNSTFKNEQEIVQAVSRWKNIYNKNHGNKAITCILQDDVPLCLHSC
jgi:transposase